MLVASPVPTFTGARSGATAFLPLGILCCIGIILFLFAVTIVLSLIPVYLHRRNLSKFPSNARRYIVLRPEQGVPAYGRTSWSACNTIANQMTSAAGLPSNVVTPLSCTFAVPSSGRRRRSRSMSHIRRQARNGKLIGLRFAAAFDFYGARAVTFVVESISNTGFSGLSTDAIPTATGTASVG
ncbi:unnamed protein product [Rotaria sordida]|uniref:Uncharacterized protein n=1 Tax=Rotaria sordida TaxID=392033 RepID=A0A814NV45_9BILA|nr:unnamed protein product [Rotaria sordida]CAF1096064.1 unnamed protein product [Rotaria sordida]CAF1098432.1 unnamed protein product [Rotaria sordida]